MSARACAPSTDARVQLHATLNMQVATLTYRVRSLRGGERGCGVARRRAESGSAALRVRRCDLRVVSVWSQRVSAGARAYVCVCVYVYMCVK